LIREGSHMPSSAMRDVEIRINRRNKE